MTERWGKVGCEAEADRAFNGEEAHDHERVGVGWGVVTGHARLTTKKKRVQHAPVIWQVALQ